MSDLVLEQVLFGIVGALTGTVSDIAVADSKKSVAAEFHISREQLDLIEKEGLDKDWLPSVQ